MHARMLCNYICTAPSSTVVLCGHSLFYGVLARARTHKTARLYIRRHSRVARMAGNKIRWKLVSQTVACAIIEIGTGAERNNSCNNITSNTDNSMHCSQQQQHAAQSQQQIKARSLITVHYATTCARVGHGWFCIANDFTVSTLNRICRKPTGRNEMNAHFIALYDGTVFPGLNVSQQHQQNVYIRLKSIAFSIVLAMFARHGH